MEVFEHGGYLVLDGTRGSLEHVADLLETTEDQESEEVAGKIRRGIDSGATRIAVEGGRVPCVVDALDDAEDDLSTTLYDDVEEGLAEIEWGMEDGER